MLERSPLCTKDWEDIAKYYNAEYAFKMGRSGRNERGLQEKFDSLCKGPPTGAGGCSEQQQHAQRIQQRIYEDQGSRRIVDTVEDILDDQGEDLLGEDELSESVRKVEMLGVNRKERAGDFAKRRLLDSSSELIEGS